MAYFDVRAEMVANVLTITVKVGDMVVAGDQLLLLESMKMEIPVLSEISGKVIEVAVVDGEVIQGGDLLVKIEYI
ncbi:MAG: biotin/lipoyl-binding carrier protein [Actinobacteria bacterium]|nr:biotin/lipoyl-binding carrier protein [Actinomycetota bacterium]MSY26959.1 biotin/lipoyl-binding carrier protein [Actinomycetota bacterium]MSZ86374.1 biotin/lipoyl-binding carrier protein [Actinomycetota bacterium]MTB14478.1 biotin/lipoyl-binding carrier protein [Actinomycetota bacterium]MTB25339.1 biotin/lipoyl-binding carrier protein [Actinomycetota bacterium]